jgi:hypothetical protein
MKNSLDYPLLKLPSLSIPSWAKELGGVLQKRLWMANLGDACDQPKLGRERLWFRWEVLAGRGRFHRSSRVSRALECTPDVVVVRAAVECEHLGTMRALRLKAIANPLDPLCKHHGALRAFYFELICDHGCARQAR